MENKSIIIKKDLHARPATLLIQKAGQFKDTSVWIKKGEKKVQINSLIGILSLGLKKDDEITLITEGKSHETAMKAIAAFIESGCSENE